MDNINVLLNSDSFNNINFLDLLGVIMVWIRSNIETNKDFPVQMDYVEMVYKDSCPDPELNHVIVFKTKSGSSMNWRYHSIDEFETEFEWILSQLDCRVNGGKTKDDFEIEELRTLKKTLKEIYLIVLINTLN